MYKEAINATTVAWTCKQELIFFKKLAIHKKIIILYI